MIPLAFGTNGMLGSRGRQGRMQRPLHRLQHRHTEHSMRRLRLQLDAAAFLLWWWWWWWWCRLRLQLQWWWWWWRLRLQLQCHCRLPSSKAPRTLIDDTKGILKRRIRQQSLAPLAPVRWNRPIHHWKHCKWQHQLSWTVHCKWQLGPPNKGCRFNNHHNTTAPDHQSTCEDRRRRRKKHAPIRKQSNRKQT